jgi:hypothetical protein
VSNDNRGVAGTPFSRQWVEIWVFVVVIWIQVILQLAFDQILAAILVSLVALGLIAHMATWAVPMIRARQTGRPR